MEITTQLDLVDLVAASKPKGTASGSVEATQLTDTPLGTLAKRSEVAIASRSTGRHLLGLPDAYAEQLSRFDCQARLNLPYSHLAATPQMYLGFAAAQVLEWTEDERAALSLAVESVRQKWARLSLALPPRVYLVKTSGREEEGRPYTRAGGVIALPATLLGALQGRARPSRSQTWEPSELERLLLAACFQLAVGHRAGGRQQLYGLVGCRLLDNPVRLPKVLWGLPGADDSLPNLRVSRPPATALQVGLEMDVPRCPWTASGQFVCRWLVPVLLAKGPYEGGAVADYLQWWFMAVEQNAAGRWEAAAGPGEKPLVYRSGPLLDQYVERIGSPDQAQVWHPDEVLAQHFVQVASQPGTGLLSEMEKVLA